MKKFLYLLTSISFLFSCSEKEKNAVVPDNVSLSATEIAKYHNLALELYHNSPKRTEINELSITQIQNEIISLMKEHHPHIMKNFTIPTNGNYLQEKYIKRSQSGQLYFDLEFFFSEGLDDLLKNHKISHNFYTQWKKVMEQDLQLYHFSYIEVKDFLSNLKRSSLTSYEENLVQIFDSVFEASNEYWTSYELKKIENTNFRALNIGTWAILGDAAGALLGAFGGSVWATIQSAAVSAAINES